MITPVMPTYGERPVAFERGEGAYLYATDGRRYLDFACGIAVTALGHAHPHLVAALKAQADKLWHVSNLFKIPGLERAAERLVANTFADTVFFCNSGLEAVECSIKVARKYQSHIGHPERWRIITVEGSFHGRSLATIAAAGQEKLLKGFGPPVEGFDHVPFNNMNALRAAIRAETAAVLFEPVQGEGGIRPFELEFIRQVRQVCDEFGLLMVLDEVQCGMGRTGKLLAHQWAGVDPDVVALAKGIGGGFPVGACLATEAAAAGMTPGSHGSTFGGNPLAMAVVNAVLDVMLAPGFLEHVQETGKYLQGRLDEVAARHPDVIAEVRGLGLMLGLRTVQDNGTVVARLRENGLLTVPAGDNVVRLLPPLVIGKAEADEAVAIVERTAAALAGGGTA